MGVYGETVDSTDGNGPRLKRLQPYLAPGVIFSGLAVIIGDTEESVSWVGSA
jgi:hypothetical protein